MAESSTPSANESVEEKLLEAQNTIQVLKNELKSTRRYSKSKGIIIAKLV